ncbi:MAG TPA: hypothetical protein VI603_12305 [Saprospiraceae bacterium]|nr:hypothetical protein [Saprospiraceae bacterium]
MYIIKRALLLGIALLTMSMSQNAQSAINIKTGLVNLRFADEDNGRHYGLSFGFDAIVEDSRFLFLPGLHYQQFDIQSTSARGKLFAGRKNFHQISLPLSMGTQIIRDRVVTLRMYVGGHLNFTIGIDENPFGVNTDKVSEVHPGFQGGLQLMLWRFTADIRYVQDFSNMIKIRDNSKLRGWEMLVGIAL